MKGKKLKIPVLVLIDVLCIGIGLNVFALFHHVLPFYVYRQDVSPTVLPTVSAAPAQTPAPVSDPQVTLTPEQEPEVPETWAQKFADHFTTGEVIRTETSYRSENISIQVSHHVEPGLIYSVADIYISDLKYLKSGFGGGSYRASTEPIVNLAEESNALVAISGDHFGARADGCVVRNGVLYRETSFEDVCIITNEGEMITLETDAFDPESIKATGAWQVWSFGPELLKDGQVKTKFNSTVTRKNPRSAIGCVEPGHYIFVQVDGRIDTSNGMSMEELSQLFYDLGCTAAYNLDGGQTAGFVWQGKLLSYPYGRPVWDIIYIGE